jgi:hypothetical protein
MFTLGKRIFSFILCLSLASCAFAPFATTPTARTNGAGQQLLQGSLVEAQVPSFRYEYGLLPNLDVGVESEFGFGSYVAGLYSKFALTPNAQGLATALILGFGKNVFGDGEYWYLGPVMSYRFAFFEPAILLRYTDTRTDGLDLNQSTGGITFGSDHIRYWYLVLSATVYPVEWLGIIFQMSDALNVKSNGGSFVDGMIFTVGLNYKF